MNHSANPMPPEARAVPPKLVVRSGNSLALALGLLAAVGVCAALFVFDPVEHAFYPRCFFHQATGLHCAGCGGLRAVHQLLHGHLLTALHLNVLAVLSLPLFSGLLWCEFAGRPGGIWRRRFVGGRWVWCFIGVLLAFTLLRNLPAFAFLAP